MPLSNGEDFAGFRIIRLLGAGGMGEVYLAQHPRLPRSDALKLLPKEWSADPDYRARFNREADLASTLWHPHIVGVHDRGEHQGQLWISMDFVDGEDLGHLLTKRYPAGMPTEQVATIVTAVASALDYAHKQGLLHRDVKPANIMLTNPDDGEQRVVLTDFGIARNVDDVSGLTTTNMTVGTVAYAAPEQLMGEEIDGRADQYALAATAYHLLTGSQLFPHSNPAVVISRHLNSPPPLLADSRPELAELDPVVSRALAKKPEHRFERAADFARALTAKAPLQSASARTQGAATPPPMADSYTNEPAGPATASSQPRGRGGIWRIAAAATVVAMLISATLLVWRPWRESSSVSTGEASVTPSTIPPDPPSQPDPTASSAPATTTTAAAQVTLPSEPPPNSGCSGFISAHHDIEHPTLGQMRIFLMDDPTKHVDAGCVSPVTASGGALPPIPVDESNRFAFAVPATDATGNIFIDYKTVRHSGVLVLVPNDYGFADIGWEYGGHYQGRYAFDFAELSGPGADGRYTITDYTQNCTPSCAEGGRTTEVLTWNGTDYIAAGTPLPENITPPSPARTPEQPSVNLESACSNPAWRNANGAEGDRLCGAPNPYG